MAGFIETIGGVRQEDYDRLHALVAFLEGGGGGLESTSQFPKPSDTQTAERPYGKPTCTELLAKSITVPGSMKGLR